MKAAIVIGILGGLALGTLLIRFLAKAIADELGLSGGTVEVLMFSVLFIGAFPIFSWWENLPYCRQCKSRLARDYLLQCPYCGKDPS